MFNENYDRTLWLMLVGDKAGRARMADFIKDIPAEAYEQIQRMINLYNESGIMESVSITKTLNAGLSRLCFDAHIFEDGELSLMVRRHQTEDKVTKVSEFLLSIMPMSDAYLVNLPLVSRKKYIGEVRDSRRNVVLDTTASDKDSIFDTSYEKEFNLMRTPVGYFVNVDSEVFVEPVNIFEESNGNMKYSKRVSVSKIPDKIYAHQFENEKRVNRLIRGKKRNIIRGK